MKRKLLYIFLICFILVGCGKKAKEPEYNINKVTLDDMPICEIECVKNGEYVLQVPDQAVETHTKGELIDYIIKGEELYILVAYDVLYKNGFYNELAVYQKNLKNGTFITLAKENYDEGVIAGLMEYNDTLCWYETTIEEKWYKCSIVDNKINKELLDAPPQDPNYDYSDKWKEGISENYLSGKINYIGANDEYVVWEQWMYADNLYKDAYINVYNKENKTISQILKDEYGIVHKPVFVGNMVAFQTIGDIKSYANENDFYSNVYTVDVTTMEEKRITENYGSTDSLDTKIFGEPKATDNTIYFSSKVKKGTEFTYEYIYYITVE